MKRIYGLRHLLASRLTGTDWACLLKQRQLTSGKEPSASVDGNVVLSIVSTARLEVDISDAIITARLSGSGSVLHIPKARPKTSHKARIQKGFLSTPLIRVFWHIHVLSDRLHIKCNFRESLTYPEVVADLRTWFVVRGSEPHVSPSGLQASLVLIFLACVFKLHSTLFG